MTDAKNRGAVITRIPDAKADPVCKLEVKDIPMPPAPGKGQVLLQIKTVGICGSDVHYWQHGLIGDFVVGEKMTLGHECAGIVQAVGEDVTGLVAGDRVAIEPGVGCGDCEYCKGDRYNLCPDMAFWATPPYDGGLCDYIIHPATHCFKLPGNVSLEEGALIEPFSVALHGCKRAGVKEGDHILITGAGPIGLVVVLGAKAFGATEITVCDIDEDRLAQAKQLGATNTINTKNVKSLAAKMNRAPNASFECTGVEWCLSECLLATKSGGKVVYIGMGCSNQKLPMLQASCREVDVLGNFRYCNTWPIALEMIAAGKVPDLKSIVTHRYNFCEEGHVEAAFTCCLQRKDSDGKPSTKVIINL